MSVSKILLTTSRNPTDRIRTLCNDLARILPNALRVNRGKMSNEQLAEKALEERAGHILLVERGQGGSGVIRFCSIGPSGLSSIPPAIHVSDIRLRRDFQTPLRVRPVRGIVVVGIAEPDGVTRFAEVLAEFLGISLLSADEATGGAGDFIAFDLDRMRRLMVTFIVEPGHIEVGPRLTVSKLEWVIGA